MGKLETTDPAKSPVPKTAPSVTSKAFAKIKSNPKNDWAISDIETACAQLEMVCTAPTRGSHYKVSSPYKNSILTIPHNRPIKLYYIKEFISLADAHIKASNEAEKANG